MTATPAPHTEVTYVEVGQCPKCKLAYRTNLSGELRRHTTPAAKCEGSQRPPDPATGRCERCNLNWPLTKLGRQRTHRTVGVACRGSAKASLRHVVVLADLYRPGEKWPKSWA